VPKLSILIAARDEALLETSLVSVLQNRPPDCEILVVHDEGYQDPYELASEVRFIAAPAASSELERLNRGVRHCQSSLVHILRCGAEVTEGWTAAVLPHFADPRVAAVAPLVLAPGSQSVVAAGIDYRAGGLRVACHGARQANELSAEPAPVLGPALSAAFYRVNALTLLREPFCPSVGSNLADVDLALRLSRAGYRAVLEPRSQVLDAPKQSISPLTDAWLAERLYWRHARHFGTGRTLAAHATVVAAEFAGCLVRPLRVGSVLGRAAGCLERMLFGATYTIPAPEPVEPPSPVRERTDLRVDSGTTGVRPQRPRRQNAPKVA
jgi:hypothetical protein